MPKMATPWLGIASYADGRPVKNVYHTEKLQDGFVETSTYFGSRGCLVAQLQFLDDDSAYDYVDDRRYQQDDRQQRVHVHLQTGLV